MWNSTISMLLKEPWRIGVDSQWPLIQMCVNCRPVICEIHCNVLVISNPCPLQIGIIKNETF